MGKLILDLCGGTGAWSRPYREAGYDVRLVTLPGYDVRDVQFGSRSMTLFGQGTHYIENLTVLYDEVYGILAAPPCTEFSLAKNGSPTPRDMRAGMEIVEACLRIIWACQLAGGLRFWAMENPLGLLRKFMGRPGYTFRHWEFGDPAVKPTDVWGFFVAPRPTCDRMPNGITRRYKSGKVNTLAWATPKTPGWYDGPPLDRAALRAITPPGFAEAFYRANK